MPVRLPSRCDPRIRGHPCHVAAPADSRISGEFSQLGRLGPGTTGGEVHVFVGAERLDQVSPHPEDQRAGPLLGVDQRGILEVLRTHPDDDVGGRGMACQRVTRRVGDARLAEWQAQSALGGGRGKKFIAGDPMKPATKRLAGELYRLVGVPICWASPARNTTTRSPASLPRSGRG